MAREDLHIKGIARNEKIRIYVNQRPVSAFPGETVMAALWAAGYRSWKKSNALGQQRGPWCAMGVCYECQVTIAGLAGIRACMKEVEEGMKIEIAE